MQIAQLLIYGGLVGRIVAAITARSVLTRVHAKVPRVINNFEDVLGREFEPIQQMFIFLMGGHLCQGSQSFFCQTSPLCIVSYLRDILEQVV